MSGLLEVLKDHQTATGRRDFRQHCTCGWFGEVRGRDFLAHQADAITAAGYIKQEEVEWGTATKWGPRASFSKQHALDYMELCKQCGDEVRLISRRAAIEPGPWEDAK